jgi:glycosyltransferase involved in cell wall biosynthesis
MSGFVLEQGSQGNSPYCDLIIVAAIPLGLICDCMVIPWHILIIRCSELYMTSAISSDIKLSVIIPTCNRNDTLPRAIYSVLNQGISDMEIIVVNDSETPLNDDILSLCDGLPVHFTTNPGKHGAASTRNYGVSVARGKYITFLDDDDVYLPGRLISMLKLAETGTYSLVSSGRFYETGDFKTIIPAPKQLFGEITLSDINFHNDIDIGFMIERKKFIQYDGFDETFRSLEDWDFIIRVLSDGKAFKIHRFDYAANIELHRPRVSHNDAESYSKMAEHYREQFGECWYAYMISHGLSLSGKLSAGFVLSSFIKIKTIKPFICYIRQFKNKLLSNQ